MVTGTLPKHSQVKAAVGTVAEQVGKKIPGQYLGGGGTQAVIDLSKEAKTQLAQLGERVMASGKAESWTDPVTGIQFTIKPTGWTDTNGIHGYFHTPGPWTVQTTKLLHHEMESKENREVSP